MTTLPAAATRRKPEMMNSLDKKTMAATAESLPSCTSSSMAAITSTLSAMGSMNLPKVVTSLRLRAR